MSELSHLDALEAESIYILREVAAQFERPAILYSVGKDSSVVLRLAEKAFAPGKLPFPLIHIDTGFDFRETYEFRDSYTREREHRLIVYRNEEAIAAGANPIALGTQACCGVLRTKALLDALKLYKVDAAIGGARRDEERSRAKERVFSIRSRFGEWDPKNQRPELWSLYNGRIQGGESVRVFPLSNWTELDVWHYIKREEIPIVPLYYAAKRSVVVRGDQLIPITETSRPASHETVEELVCRFRTLGCDYCTGAVRSTASTLDEIIAEMTGTRTSERATRIIDHDADGSMETKKREGYF